MSEANKNIVRELTEQVFNARNLDRLGEFYAPGYVDHDVPSSIESPQSVDEMRRSFEETLSAAPDLRWNIQDMVADGDKVAIRQTIEGTHSGEFMGIPPTGKTFVVRSMAILRLVDGKIVERWGVEDRLEMMQALGALPSMGQGEG